jgi:hypothetical protein
MNEVEILRTVFEIRKPHWGGNRRYTYEQFRDDLGVSNSSRGYLSDSLISGILHGRDATDDDRILRYLSGPGSAQADARKRVEQGLRLEGLFKCKNLSDVVALVSDRDGRTADQPAANFTILDPSRQSDFGLCQAEQLAIRCIVDEVTSRPQPVLHLATVFNSGASVLAWNLIHDPRCTSAFSKLILLRPSGPLMDFEAETARLRDYLDSLQRSVATTRLLLDSIISERLLVVIFSPYVIDAQPDTNSLKRLIRECELRRSDWNQPANILLVGESEWITRATKNAGRIITSKVKDIFAVKGDQRFPEFRVQWERFTRSRKQPNAEESGSRMRRAATYYQNQAPTTLWPISIKLRALFASNSKTYSYFDPTQGFSRLAGPHFSEFDDIVSYHDDVRDYIAYIQQTGGGNGSNFTGKGKYYYLLQYASTAIYWLTEEALEVLIDKVGPDRPNPLRLATEKKRIREFSPVVTEKSSEVGSEAKIRYFTSLPVKAIIQDDWMDADPYARALAHYRIADRLKENENNKDLLDREFPYEPHWGRSRMYFIAETIRHLMRSCEKAKSTSEPMREPIADRFPCAPQMELNGTDAVEVVNYCYSILYQRDLNGNKNGRNSRSLAKKYGAYQLAAELLELMSEAQNLGSAHHALQKQKRNEFIRECGFALLDIGELERSKDCFDSIESTIDDKTPMDEVINVLLDQSILVGDLGNLEAAKEYNQRAEDEIKKLHSQYISADPKPNSREYARLRRHYRRLLFRMAHTEYLSGNDELALVLLGSIESESSWKFAKSGEAYKRTVLVPSFTQRLEAEQEHLLIAIMCKGLKREGAHASSVILTAALDRCLKALLRAQSAGVHHEAMGFRILLARIFRRMGYLSTAEVILDEVHRDVLMYGCSERTFLAFLNEAGRVLFGLGDAIRSYATYIRPSVIRSMARGYHREAEQAAKLALDVLSHMLERIDAPDLAGVSWQQLTNRALKKHEGLVREMNALFRGAPIEKDPLFAYSVADSAEIIRKVADKAGISAEINFVTDELRAPRPPRGRV